MAKIFNNPQFILAPAFAIVLLLLSSMDYMGYSIGVNLPSQDFLAYAAAQNNPFDFMRWLWAIYIVTSLGLIMIGYWKFVLADVLLPSLLCGLWGFGRYGEKTTLVFALVDTIIAVWVFYKWTKQIIESYRTPVEIKNS